MTDPNTTPDWLELSSEPVKIRKKREAVTVVQKELIFKFISENPELITHSSTKECELELWTELTKTANELQPSKSLDFWRLYWKRWMGNIMMKPDSSLTMLDSKVKKFLTNLGIENYNNANKDKEKDKGKEVNVKIKDLESEKATLTLEIDQLDYKIVQYKIRLNELSKVIREKKKRIREITTTKKILCEKKMKTEGNKTMENESDSDE